MSIEWRELLKDVMARWLVIQDWEAIDVVVATVLTIFMPGDPVWLFLVKPSGGTGTELLRSFTDDYIHHISSLTPHTLHSGKPGVKGLLYQLDNKVLVIKDFTSILGLRDNDRNQIFSDLRDAYDGYSNKAYGSGAEESKPVAKFGIVAAVTSVIDKYRVVQSVLGERFLKVRMMIDEKGAVRKARQVAGKEEQMRHDLRNATTACLEYYRGLIPNVKSSEGQIGEKIENLAILLGRLRSGVMRDRQHIVQYQPDPEVGTRLVKQLEKLGQALACFQGKERVSEAEYRTLVRLARDSTDAQRWKLIRELAEAGCAQTTKELADKSRMPVNTTREVLENAMMLDIVDRELSSDEYHWSLTKDVAELSANTGLVYDLRKPSGNGME